MSLGSIQYVEEVIELLELQDLADAMIGVPGFGLGVEARKRLTIGVELAAKPQLLLFLDEPTSGLDGQSAFNVVRFLRKLPAAGQAILCTIHQPNSMLFEHFGELFLFDWMFLCDATEFCCRSPVVVAKGWRDYLLW